MHKIKYVMVMISFMHMLNIMSMDEMEGASLLLLKLPANRKLQCDNFSHLVSNDAAFLRLLVMEGRQQYCPSLKKAEETLQQVLQKMRATILFESEVFSKQCDKDSRNFISLIAEKERLCEKLIKNMDAHEEIESILSENQYVVNHYVTVKRKHLEHKITPLHYVIEKAVDNNKCVEYVRTLLCAGANPNAVDDCGDTSLHKATSQELIRLLFRFDVQPNSQNIFGHTPLISRIYQGHNESAEYLIRSGVMLDSQDGDGNTALHHAVNKNNDAIIGLLLEYGANFDVQNAKKVRPFCNESNAKKRKSLENDEKRRKKVEPYIQRSLCLALAHNDSATVRRLVKDYPWINFVVDGTPIMQWAKQYYSNKSVETFKQSLFDQLLSAVGHESNRFITAGAPINQSGHNQVMPLMLAIQDNDKSKIKILLRNDAKVTQAMIEYTQADDVRNLLQRAYNKQSYSK